MSLEAAQYRSWTRHLLPNWLACWPIARTALLLVLRRRLFWLLLALAGMNFLFVFATIYFKAQIGAENPAIKRFVDQVLRSVTGTGETYRDFMFAQGTVTMLLLAFAGATIVGDDLRQGGLTFYLSRRVSRWHYVMGKLLAIGLLVSLTTTVPALVLYVEYGVLTDSTTYFTDNLGILRGILGYGLALAVALSLLLFALSSWLQKTVPLVMAWACVFLLLPALALLLREVYDERNWQLLMLWRYLRLIGTWCFGGLDSDNELAQIYPALAIMVGVWVASWLVITTQVRAVKVVT